MLKCKIAWNSIWQACTWQTAVEGDQELVEDFLLEVTASQDEKDEATANDS